MSFAPFKSRIFLSIWAATLISNIGAQVHTMAAAWVMADMSPSPLMVAMVQVASSLPFLLFALLAGTLSDLFDKRLLMLAAQSMAVVASAGLAAVALFGQLSPVFLLTILFLLSTGAAFYSPVWQSSIHLQVPREHLAAAVGINVAGFNLARCLSPALGGALLTSLGAAWAFVLNTITYLGIIIVIALWRLPKRAPDDNREPIVRSMKLGLRYVWMTLPMRVVIVRVLFVGFCGAVFWSLFPVMAKDQLGGGVGAYSTIMLAFGVGAVAGGVLTAKLRSLLGAQRVALFAQLVLGAAAVAVNFSVQLWLSCVFVSLAGASWMCFLAIMNSSIQLSAPQWVVGRAVAIYQMTVFGALAAGSAFWGYIASILDVGAAFYYSGLICLLAAVYAWLRPLKDFGEIRAGIADLSSSLLPDKNLISGNAPIVIGLRYRIDSRRQAEFLEVMRELRCIRLRLGCVDWSLAQSLESPSEWVERFTSPDWDGHVQRTRRWTEQDNDVRLTAERFDKFGRPEASRWALRDAMSSDVDNPS